MCWLSLCVQAKGQKGKGSRGNENLSVLLSLSPVARKGGLLLLFAVKSVLGHLHRRYRRPASWTKVYVFFFNICQTHPQLRDLNEFHSRPLLSLFPILPIRIESLSGKTRRKLIKSRVYPKTVSVEKLQIFVSKAYTS